MPTVQEAESLAITLKLSPLQLPFMSHLHCLSTSTHPKSTSVHNAHGCYNMYNNQFQIIATYMHVPLLDIHHVHILVLFHIFIQLSY